MTNIRSPDNQLLTRAEVARIFRVSPSTVTRWAEAGKLPMVKTLGGHRRYEAGAVLALAHQTNMEEVTVKKSLIKIPTMYGDHHVIEVRRILLAIPGVETVNASSRLQTVEVSYDQTNVSEDEIKHTLNENGYFGELPAPVETGRPVSQEAKLDGEILFRHTAAYAQTREAISFAQDVNGGGRPLWPCPGMGVIERAE